MKKIILGIFLFIISPLMVSATDVDYDITDYQANVQVLASGDVLVNEIIILDGEFNGYIRELMYKPTLDSKYESSSLYGASDITDVSIKAKYVKEYSDSLFTDTDYTILNKYYSASNGDKGKYVELPLMDGRSYKMFYPSDDDKVAFNLTYTLKDVIVVHNDIAELYYPFIGDAFLDDIKRVGINVSLPGSSSTEYLRVWAHGPLYGEVELNGNSKASLTVKDLESNTPVDIRLLFDKVLITNSFVKKSYTDSFDNINEIEAKKGADADQVREMVRKKRNTLRWLVGIFYILLITLSVYIYFKYAKSPKSNYYSKYNREFIDDYNVEVVDYLMHHNITPNAMSASIMNLIYKKNINALEIEDGSKKKNYKFILNNKDNINENEDILIGFLFDRVGSTSEDGTKNFTTMDLKKYASGTKTCNTFISSYTKWKNKVLKESKDQGFFERSNTPIIFGIMMLILSFVIFFMTLSVDSNFVLGYLAFVLGFIFFASTFGIYKKTEKGSLHYAKWSAFKNFLNDFGTFELKELPEVVLWERYLVYATVFGLANKVNKAMNVKITEVDPSMNIYMPSYFYFNLADTLNTSVSSALNSAYSKQISNSSSSSSGFGGGFSGGSGFSGGGGGHGF